MGDTVEAAQHKHYELAKAIESEGCFYRNDIGYRAIARERGDDQE